MVRLNVTRLDLELDLDGEPISGQLALPGDSPVGFTGYTGLIAAVETIRERERQQPAATATDGFAPARARRRNAP